MSDIPCLIACNNKQAAIYLRKRSDELDFKFSRSSRNILQNRFSSLVAGYDVINSTITEIGKLRNEAEFGKILQKFPLQLSHPPNKLKKSVLSRFREDLTTEHTGIHNQSESLNLKASCFEIIDTNQREFSQQFSEFNMSLNMGVRRGRQNGYLTPPLLEIGFKNQNFLENMKSAAQFRLIDSILTMADYLPWRQ